MSIKQSHICSLKYSGYNLLGVIYVRELAHISKWWKPPPPQNKEEKIKAHISANNILLNPKKVVSTDFRLNTSSIHFVEVVSRQPKWL